jgi:hypothetical protein
LRAARRWRSGGPSPVPVGRGVVGRAGSWTRGLVSSGARALGGS